MTVKFRV